MTFIESVIEEKTESKGNSIEDKFIADTSLTVSGGKSIEGEPVLLKTAVVSISDMKGTQSCEGRFLFDDASSRTYITRNLFNTLGLRPVSKRQSIINGACATATLTNCGVL